LIDFGITVKQRTFVGHFREDARDGPESEN
jgi:hypothetical protein